MHPEHQRFNAATCLAFQQSGRSVLKPDPILSMPPPLQPDPVHPFQTSHDGNDQDRSYNFSRHAFFEELGEDGHASGALPPPAPQPHQPNENETHAGLGVGIDTGHSLPGHMDGGMSAVPTISNLPLPTISGAHIQGHLNSASPFGSAGTYANSRYGTGPSDLVDGITEERKFLPFHQQRKMRSTQRSRAQQMTESQRKKRHNEHTRASRSRIDRGLERLKAVIKKVRPQQKVNKKADVLHEAVKLLKEGFHLPKTASDDERDEPQESSLSV